MIFVGNDEFDIGNSGALIRWPLYLERCTSVKPREGNAQVGTSKVAPGGGKRRGRWLTELSEWQGHGGVDGRRRMGQIRV